MTESKYSVAIDNKTKKMGNKKLYQTVKFLIRDITTIFNKLHVYGQVSMYIIHARDFVFTEKVVYRLAQKENRAIVTIMTSCELFFFETNKSRP